MIGRPAFRGLDFGECSSVGAVVVAEKARAREQAERRRLFYVGMTRARERLVLSGALSKRPVRGALLELLEEAAGTELDGQERAVISLAGVELPHTILKGAAGTVERTNQVGHLARRGGGDGGFPSVGGRDRIWRAYRSERRLSRLPTLSAKPLQLSTANARTVKPGWQGKTLGTMVHRLLQHWDFAAEVEPQLAAMNVTALGPDGQDDQVQQSVMEEIGQIVRSFAQSAPCDRSVRRATVIGREVPFLMPWNEGRQILEGVIDLLYRLDRKLWIADYKTDRVPPDQRSR